MIGGIVSRRWRCATLLMLPSLFAGRGRAFMLTTATAFLLSGPVATVDHNIQVDLINKLGYSMQL